MNRTIWDSYQTLLGDEVISPIFQLAKRLDGAKIVHVNATRSGGGVAEILMKMVPLMQALNFNTKWETIEGNADFFTCTKTFHNLFQGKGTDLPSKTLLRNFEEVNKQNSLRLGALIEEADFVMIHDPQPLAMMPHLKKGKAKWIWRCHIDTSHAPKAIWNYLRPFIELFDASVYSLPDFSPKLNHPMFIIPPGTDPFSEKNVALSPNEIHALLSPFGIDFNRPTVLQVSRFDRFKDPLGVIQAYKIAKEHTPDLQLILVGGAAADDPEGAAVFNEVQEAKGTDPDIYLLNLPSDSHRIINALQTAANIVIQKSVKEGFGLTVTEALWKSKPVIAGNTGGIRIQVIDRHTGLLVDTPEGAASAIGLLLENPELGKAFGQTGRQHVQENFLMTRELRDYLAMMTLLKKN